MRDPVKCLVWDLDDTLWQGTLIEGDPCVIREGVRQSIQALDARGILQSVASLSDPALSGKRLAELGLREYFLHPQMSLEANKPDQILGIAEHLRIDLAHIGFIDDDAFRRAEVADALPAVRIFDACQAHDIAELDDFRVAETTAEAAGRRAAYRADEGRRRAETRFEGPRADFLRACEIVARMGAATPDTALRIAELSLRTNRMNASERRFDVDEIGTHIADPNSRVQLLRLSDRFGDLGIVGATLVDRTTPAWQLRALMVSCRAMGRGIGETLLVDVLRSARTAGAASVEIHYATMPSNRGMALLFASQGFRVIAKVEAARHYRHDLAEIPPLPGFLEVEPL